MDFRFPIHFDDPGLVGRRLTLVFTERADGRLDGTVFPGVVIAIGRGPNRDAMLVRLKEPLMMAAESVLREGTQCELLALLPRGFGWYPRVAQFLFRQIEVYVFDGAAVTPVDMPRSLGSATLTWRS